MIWHKRIFGLALAAFFVIIISASVRVAYVIKEAPPNVTPLKAIESSIQDTLSIENSFWNKDVPNEPVVVKTYEPHVTARAYLVGNVTTGHVYAASNASVALPVASMSKLITVLAALNIYTLDKPITITKEELNVPPDTSLLQAGETYSLKEIMYPLLLSSSNVAAEALASSTNRADFFNLMSSYAWEIGMPNSFFADPSGIDPRNRASAKDIFALSQYLIKYHPEILLLTRTANTSVGTTTNHGSHIFASTHPFVNDPRFLGGKTGRTEAAGETMLTILSINGQKVAFIVLGSEYGMREKDTRLLIIQTQSSI